MASLQVDESLKFLNDVLKLNITGTEDVPSLSVESTSEDKLSFLETLIRAYLEYEPFQSISLMSQNITERHRPEWETIKQEMFGSRGGLCYSLNSFFYALLASLGFEVSLGHATVGGTVPVPDNHIVVLVHDLVVPEDLFLVDVGCGICIPRAIPLNFDNESSEYTDSFLTYKFVRESKNKIVMLKKNLEKSWPGTHSESHFNKQESMDIVRGEDEDSSEKLNIENSAQKLESVDDGKGSGHTVHGESAETDETPVTPMTGHEQDLVTCTSETGGIDKVTCQTQQIMKSPSIGQNSSNSDTEKTEWKEFFSFNPLQRFQNLGEFYQCFNLCYSDITKLSMHTSPRIMCWRNGRYVAVVNSKLITEVENGQLVKTDLLERKVDRTGQYYSEDIFSQMEPLIQIYVQYFPQFPVNAVSSAMRNWTLTGSLAKLPAHLS